MLMLSRTVGVGEDGHIGSLYPHREEVLVDDQLVLSVDKVNTNYSILQYRFDSSLHATTGHALM